MNGIEVRRSRFVNREKSATQGGAILVELALVTPILALLLAILLHFGMTFRTQQIITNASRVGARRGCQASASSGAMQTAVQNYIQAAGLDTSMVSVTATAGASGVNSSCRVDYTYTSTVQGFIDNLLTRPIAGGTAGGSGTWWTAQPAPPRTLSATTVMHY